MKAAAEAGATGVEFDVMLTGDGEPVLFHDDTLQRTTGIAGEMPRTPFATVRGLDASLGFSRRYGRLGGRAFAGRPDRSDEHTSELQSLMPVPYAVFCSKKENAHLRSAEPHPHLESRKLPANTAY